MSNERATLQIEIYDIAGKLVFTAPVGEGLVPSRTAGDRESRPYECRWQPGENIPSGIYLVKVKSGNSETTKRVVYLK
jgi:hypothetical protein